MTKLLSYEGAKRAGHKTFRGKPCPKGHQERYVRHDKRQKHACATCNRTRVKKWRVDYPDKKRALNMRRYKADAPYPPPENCELCGTAADLHFDHCHDSEAFRGWLCMRCNTGLGMLGDNIEGLERALAYLRREL